MSEEEINEIVKEHYGFTVEEIDNMVGNLSLKINQLEQERNKYKELYEKVRDKWDVLKIALMGKFNSTQDTVYLDIILEMIEPLERK